MSTTDGGRSKPVSIGVVIPARNSGPFIETALGSVLAQTRLPDEVIVVDDGSSDDTSTRVQEFCRSVELVRVEPRGVAAARNVGVSTATADFVAFLDADDVWEVGHLERMAAAVEATRGRGALYFSDMRLADAHGGDTIWSHCDLAMTGQYEIRDSDKTWLFAPRQPMLIQASVVSRKVHQAVGGSDARLTRRSDTHLLFKIGLTGPMCAVAGICGDRTAYNERSLTKQYAPSHRVYDECTVCLYGDLLASRLPLDRDQRRILRRRAASAHLSLAARHPGYTLAHLWAALRLDARTPALACRRLTRRLVIQRLRPTAP